MSALQTPHRPLTDAPITAESGLPFNRVLHPDDYRHPALAPWVSQLRQWRAANVEGARYVFHRNDHTHRDWEYAEVLRKLDAFGLAPTPKSLHPYPLEDPPTTRILDTGFGCSYFTLMLRCLGYDVHASDSEAYGAVRDKLIEQCFHLGITVPLIIAPVEDHGGIPDGHFDVTMCISVIEHIERAKFWTAWAELARVTKPGGYVFVTSDYFRDADHWLHSQALGCQHNRFDPETVQDTIERVRDFGLTRVGSTDGFAYRGDFVNNYSFVTLTFQKDA